ncbi:unnamed protein product [Euphydryas editha]|uniref:Uncharacterized protein n=1 Tax=Euphydryas editha TaxID=104508 RepID=A0AAU9U119_EUPED|nr:unnamed protein product [Euphydryas editha]
MSSAGMSQDMTQLFQMMKTEFDQQTAIVTKSVNETIMHIIDEKLHLFLEENKYLKNEVQRLKEKVKYLDEQNRKNNLLLHGIKETEKNHQELFNLIKQTLKNLDIEIDIYEINNFYRLGKKQGDSKWFEKHYCTPKLQKTNLSEYMRVRSSSLTEKPSQQNNA